MINYIEELDSYLKRLFPITRSITGVGNRETLKILKELIPLNLSEYPTGQVVYDWTIPKEWNIKDAWIKNMKGEKLINFKDSNLHIVSYSTPIHQKLNYKELIAKLHHYKKYPDGIPYRTSYYNEDWGFCLSYNQFIELFKEGEEYEVFIDSELKNGSLSIGELLIKGKSPKEHLISCYICHPSMANDSISGVLVTAFLARELLKKQATLEHSYRIIFVPETIGAITYCANNEKAMKSINHGLVITTCGGPGKFGYKQSWKKEDIINKMVDYVFSNNNIQFNKYPFDVHGSDERQYSSQGFRINCITISKDKYYKYDYYHTSLDNLDFVKATYLNESLNLYIELVNMLDKNIIYVNKNPNCEVMLSKHDLYPKIGGRINQLDNNSIKSELDIMLELLFYCNGKISLFELSIKLNIDIMVLYTIAEKMRVKNIMKILL